MPMRFGGVVLTDADAVTRIVNAKDHYEALGCPRDALLALDRAHTDLSAALQSCSVPNADEALKRVKEAHKVLRGDEASRRVYDFELARRKNEVKDPSTGQVLRAPYGYVDPNPKKKPDVINTSAAGRSVQSMVDVDESRDRAQKSEVQELQSELKKVKEALAAERSAARDRSAKMDIELGNQKRAAAEARAERDRIKASFEARVTEEVRTRMLRSDRALAEANARIASLEQQVATVARGGAKGASQPAVPPATLPAAPARRKVRSLQQDEFGHWVSVETEVEEEEYLTTSSGTKYALSTTGVDPSKAAALADSMSAELVALLERLGLGQFSKALEEEELYTLELLRSMGPMLPTNMQELGMDEGMAARLQAALG